MNRVNMSISYLKRTSLAMLSLLAIGFPVHADLNAALDQAVKKLSMAIPAGSKKDKPSVTVGQFSLNGLGVTSPALDWIAESVETKLVETNTCDVVKTDKKTLDEVMGQAKLQDAGVFRAGSPDLLGELRDADYVVDALVTDKGDTIEVRLKLTKRPNSLKGSATLDVATADLPQTLLPVKPRINETIQQVLKPNPAPSASLPTVDRTPSDALLVSISPDRMARPVYQAGEFIMFNVWANRPCFVYMFYTDADGKMMQLLPNDYSDTNYLDKGNKTYSFGAKEDPYRFKIIRPLGTELLQVFALDKPLTQESGEFGDMTKGILAHSRGIVAHSRGVIAHNKGITASSKGTPVLVDEDVTPRKLEEAFCARGVIAHNKGIDVVANGAAAVPVFRKGMAMAKCTVVTTE